MLLIPLLGANSAPGAFLGVVACEEAYDERIYHYARVIWAESRGESREGKLAVMDGVRNGAHGYKEGKLDTEIVELVAGEIEKPVRHPYRHWINLELATDARQIRIACKAIRNRMAFKVENHWFY